MEMDMVDFLVRNAAIVLKHVVAIALFAVNVEVERNGNAFGNGQDLAEMLVGDVVELGAMVLGNDEGVAGRCGSNVHESKGLGGLKKLEGRNIAW